MDPIYVIDRESGKKEEEQVFGKGALKLLYGNSLGKPFAHLISRIPLVSVLFGFWQKLSITKKNVIPFIENYKVDSSEFLESPESFQSFNDFFIRKLKPEARPIAQGKEVAVMPADGRYRFFQNISETDGFVVKGEQFNLTELVGDTDLAAKYAQGAMVMARLCPTDYHRFHFPVDCTPSESHLINGYLYSVNPIAIKNDIHIFTKNKRMITTLATKKFGDVLFIEIGATNVGSIIQTFTPNQPHLKGAEKGYFSFGGSALIILFKPGKITLDPDLLGHDIELKCLMGQSMGRGTP